MPFMPCKPQPQHFMRNLGAAGGASTRSKTQLLLSEVTSEAPQSPSLKALHSAVDACELFAAQKRGCVAARRSAKAVQSRAAGLISPDNLARLDPAPFSSRFGDSLSSPPAAPECVSSLPLDRRASPRRDWRGPAGPTLRAGPVQGASWRLVFEPVARGLAGNIGIFFLEGERQCVFVSFGLQKGLETIE